MDANVSVTRGVRRVWGVMAMALLAAPLMWGAGGCKGQETILEARPLPGQLMDLPTLKEFIKGNSRLWRTLSADCTVIIRSPQIDVEGGQVAFRRGHLQIQKPGKIRLTAQDGPHRISLVGDGNFYRVDLAAFDDAYQGAYGSPLPVTARRILLMPDDLVMAWDLTDVFADKAQVLKNLPGGSVIDSIEPVFEPTKGLRVKNSVAFDRRQRLVTSLEKFEDHGAVRAQIVLGVYDTLEGPDNKPVQIPRTVWLSYPITMTSIAIELRNIEINTEIPESTFAMQP